MRPGHDNQWRRLSELFDVALDRTPEERPVWLSSIRAAEPDLAAELESMLSAHERAGVLDARASLDLDRTRSEAPADGRKIGPYRLLERVGEGGMGVVYKALDERLQRFVALKFLSSRLADSAFAKEQFRVEARAASALDHPNICTIYDIGEENGQLYIAMAYCDGETLASRLQHGPLPVEESVRIATAIAAGLACAHEASIVHRDIKPSNVMLTSRGDVKVLDFGVAKLDRAGESSAAGRVGTVLYAAPEQVNGGVVDGRADLWSLGVVLYEMLTGARPFEGRDEAEISRAVLNSDADTARLGPDVPAHVARAVRRALAKRPGDRFANAGEFAEALRRPYTDRDLPVAMTSFIGREKELERAESLVREARLLTMTGPAGTGKTRLALEVARRLASEFRHGSTVVELSAITNAELVLPAIAQALEVFTSDARTIRDDVIAAVRERNLLLVLDNFEQVAAAAPAVAALLKGAPGLKIIATSRVPLRLMGEHEMPVPPLPPTPACELFIERARAVKPAFEATRENLEAIEEICKRVDGLPLAIELAAARVKVFSPQAIVARLGSRLDLLKSGARDRPARHQTLRQALAWSYDLLDESERRLFRRCGVFAGGFNADSAERVNAAFDSDAPEALDVLCSLVDQSLVVQREGPDGEPRFYLLETMREYALELLAQHREDDRARRAHAERFAEVARKAGDALTGSQQAVWLSALDADQENVRAALSWLESRGDIRVALEIATGVWRFWTARGHQREGRAWLERLIARADDRCPPELMAAALNGCGTLAHGSCDLEAARGFLERALALYRDCGDTHGTGLVLNNLSWIAIEGSDFERARSLAAQAFRIHVETGDKRGQAVALNNLGWVANYTADFDAALDFHERSVEFRRAAGDLRGAAFALSNAAWVEQRRGKLDRAGWLVAEAFHILEGVPDDLLRAWACQIRAAIAYDSGRYAEAAAAVEGVLPVWKRVGNSSGLAFGSAYLTLALLRLGEAERAAAVLDEAESAVASMAQPWGVAMLKLVRARHIFATRGAAAAIPVCSDAIEHLIRVGDRHMVREGRDLMDELTALA